MLKTKLFQEIFEEIRRTPPGVFRRKEVLDNPHYWKVLAKWLKENEYLAGRSRAIVYLVGDTLGQGKRISRKQARAADLIWGRAEKLGWSTEVAKTQDYYSR